jgi:hypothetical protein
LADTDRSANIEIIVPSEPALPTVDRNLPALASRAHFGTIFSSPRANEFAGRADALGLNNDIG